MKTVGFCLLILSLSVLQLNALNYNTLAEWTAPTAGLCTSPPANTFESPVRFLSERCGAYESFSIDLPVVTSVTATFDAAAGAYQVPYTGGTMNVDGKSFTTSRILIRVPAEHNLPNVNTAQSMELQIELNGDGVLSFILIASSESAGLVKSLAALTVVEDYTAGNVVTLKLDTLSSKITEKITTQDLYLNMFYYQGTTTYPPCSAVSWFVYGSPLAINADFIANAKAALATQSATLTTTPTGGNNRRIGGTTGGGHGDLAAVRLCYTGYFKNYMNYNYGLWFGVVIIVGWFIANLMLSEKPIKDTEYQETTWTNHPLYSIYHVGNDLFTRKTRMSLLLGTITIHALFSSVWYRRTNDENRTRGSNIIVYAVYSMLVDWAFIFIIGSILRGYYVAKHQYYKTKEEAWQQKSQNRLFGFYFCIFLLTAVLWPFCVWNMSELHPEVDGKASDYWVASFFIGMALEFLVADPIICLLAKSITPLKNLIKHRGYMYDNVCHETYLDYLKMD